MHFLLFCERLPAVFVFVLCVAVILANSFTFSIDAVLTAVILLMAELCSRAWALCAVAVAADKETYNCCRMSSVRLYVEPDTFLPVS